MKKGAGSRKGAQFERAVAKALSLWLTSGIDSTQLVRSELSGGWARGKTGDAPWRHIGDLAPNGKIGDAFRRHYGIETKHYRTIDLWTLWTAPHALIVKWWTKLNAECALVEGLNPMIIFRANNRPVMVGVSCHLFESRHPLQPEVPLLPPEYVRSVAAYKWIDLAVFPLEQLLEIPPERFLADAKGGGWD